MEGCKFHKWMGQISSLQEAAPEVHHTASKLAPIIHIRLFQETLYYRQMKQSHKKIGTIEAASKTDSRIERQTQK